MKNSLENFIKQVNELDVKIGNDFSEPQNNRYPIYDGPLSIEHYYNSKLKVLWLMKEPYDDANGEGGEWCFKSEFKNWDFVKGLVFGKAKGTWQPVVYTSYAMMNNYQPYDSMEYIRDDHAMMESLYNIAWVNIQKLPSKNTVRTQMSDVWDAARKHKTLLQNQISLLNPDVIVCGGTIEVAKFLLDDVEENEEKYLVHRNCVVIPAYHPSQRTMKRRDYVDGIANSLRYQESKILSV